jgi:hypothetical protein
VLRNQKSKFHGWSPKLFQSFYPGTKTMQYLKKICVFVADLWSLWCAVNPAMCQFIITLLNPRISFSFHGLDTKNYCGKNLRSPETS